MRHGRGDLSITARLFILAIAIAAPVIAFAGLVALRYADAERLAHAEQIQAALAITGAGLLVFISGAAWWAGRCIAAPLSALSLSAASLGRGEEPSLPPPGISEATRVGLAMHSAYNQLLRRDEALRAGESRYRAIFETARDAIIVFDEQSSVTAFNDAAAALTGFAENEILGQSVKRLLAPGADNGGAGDDFPPVGGNREIEIVRKDGDIVVVDLTVGEWQTAGRRHFTAILHDLTGRRRGEALRRRLEEQLRHAQKMEAIGELTGGIAHDFNNLLLAISLNLEGVGETIPPPAPGSQLLDGAQRAVEQARALIGQLLAFARRQTLNPSSLDLAQAIIETAPMLRRTIPVTIGIETKMGRNLWPAFADAHQFVTALLNLALNARDAMPEGGRLIIEAANAAVDEAFAAAHPELAPGDYLMIAVSDTGVGMPPEVAARAIEPFFTTKGVRGTGLGLSQVYGYARQSGGDVVIETAPGAGTRVALYLPRSRVAVSPIQREDIPLDPVRGESILLVEDTPVVRQAVAYMLADLGYRVIAASDGPEALAILEEGLPIDLLFTDVVLPNGLSGYDLAAMARRRYPTLRVLFTSGYSAASGNAADLLAKPYSKAELAARLRRVLGANPSTAAVPAQPVSLPGV